MTSDHKPLAGKRVVVTRAPEQAQELVRELERYGAEVILQPAVSYADPENFAPLDHALRELATFDWLLFTSQNAVSFFAKRCRALGIEARPPNSQKPKIAAVGPATAQAVAKEELPLYLIASQSQGAVLAKDLRKQVNGKKVLLPRSDRAAADLPSALRSAKAKVTEVIAYRTIPSSGPLVKPAGGGKHSPRSAADVYAFASPSAFSAFTESLDADHLRALSKSAQFAAIGPTTAAAIHAAGLPVEIVAGESTSLGLAAAIAKYFEQLSEVKSR
ncbi:MAG: uroporphyrinogen-III synthase [Candidatus Acidiferrales bacterium]